MNPEFTLEEVFPAVGVAEPTRTLPNWRDLANLYLFPDRFFSERQLGAGLFYPLILVIVSLAYVVEQIDEGFARSDLGLSGAAAPEFIWPIYWTLVITMSVFGGAWLWWVGGWWYRLRLNWSGDPAPDKREARLVFFYANFVVALPMVLSVVAATFLYADFEAYWASDLTWWDLLTLVLPFWGAVVSYKGVIARFNVERKRARQWFLILPIVLYVIAFLVYFLAFLFAG